MHFIAHLIHVYGLLTVAAIVGLECAGIPLPGETALLAAAVYAGTKHDLNIVAVILTTASAAIVGRMIGYVIGREYGYWVLLRYGGYVRHDRTPDQTRSVSVLALRRHDRLCRPVRAGAADFRRNFCRRQCHALAQFPPRQCGRLDASGRWSTVTPPICSAANSRRWSAACDLPGGRHRGGVSSSAACLFTGMRRNFPPRRSAPCRDHSSCPE